MWPHTVALRNGVVDALIGTGSAARLVESVDDGVSWRVATTARTLDPSGQLSLTGVGWTAPDRVWLSGVAAGGHPVLYESVAGGAGWRRVALATSGSAPAAQAPFQP